MLKDLLKKRLNYISNSDRGPRNRNADSTSDAFLDAEINAKVVKDSERYYRSMYYADDIS